GGGTSGKDGGASGGVAERDCTQRRARPPWIIVDRAITPSAPRHHPSQLVSWRHECTAPSRCPRAGYGSLPGSLMKFTVLALDYDGTIARNDALEPDVRRAIAEVRARGITVAIVTGRILDDLRRVAGDLRFVDVVVAENGAVIAFPEHGQSVVTAAPVSQDLIAEIRRRGISIEVGQCVLEADAQSAPHILDAIRTLSLPYVLMF